MNRRQFIIASCISAHLPAQVYVGEVQRGGIDAPKHKEGSIHGTVVVGITISEGVVVAADSRTTSPTRVISDYTSKLFDVSNAGIATYGQAFIGGRNIAALIGDFRATNPRGDVDAIADQLRNFVATAYDTAFPQTGARPILGFLIAGYAHGIGRLLRVEFPNDRRPTVLHTTNTPGADWNGSTDIISRLVLGFDPRLGALPIIAGLPADQLPAVRQQLQGLQYNIPFDALTLQDGIDLALFLVRSTVEMQRFADGTVGAPGQIPNVGGAVDVLVVTPTELRWIRRKELRAE